MDSSLDGIMLIDKETDMTSFDVIRKIKFILKDLNIKTKIGHTGTLDPFASGLLIVLFGKCTRLSDYLMNNIKTYSGVFREGRKTITGDLDGDVIKEAPYINSKCIVANTDTFKGSILQVPPYYSALKHKGKKLYEYARQGILIEKPARKIQVYDLDIKYIGEGLYSFKTVVSKGTYVRKLIEDYVESVGGLCYLEALRRENMEPYSVGDAIKSSDLSANNFKDRIMDINKISLPFPAIEISEEESLKLRHGIKINTNSKNMDTLLIKDCKGVLAIGGVEDNIMYTKCFLRDL